MLERHPLLTQPPVGGAAMPNINDIPDLSDAERIRDRFFALTKKTDTCWLWTAHKMRLLPYGRMTVHRGWYELAHRISYVLHVGPIPDGLHILHRCDNPSCVRPDHLFPGSNSDNVADKVAKGRQSFLLGEKHPSAKLNNASVAFIFRSRKSGVALAEEFGVSTNVICRIRRGKSWTHITSRL